MHTRKQALPPFSLQAKRGSKRDEPEDAGSSASEEGSDAGEVGDGQTEKQDMPEEEDEEDEDEEDEDVPGGHAAPELAKIPQVRHSWARLSWPVLLSTFQCCCRRILLPWRSQKGCLNRFRLASHSDTMLQPLPLPLPRRLHSLLMAVVKVSELGLNSC